MRYEGTIGLRFEIRDDCGKDEAKCAAEVAARAAYQSLKADAVVDESTAEVTYVGVDEDPVAS